MAKFAVVLPAAGKSSRFHDRNYKKPFAPLGDRAVWLHTIDRFLNRDDVAQVVLVISEEDRAMFDIKFGANIAILGIDVVNGGADRVDSVRAGVQKVRADIDFVAVHDAVRPCLTNVWIDQVFAAAKESGAAILAQPITATLKRSANGKTIDKTVDRSELWEAQTPQVFRRELLLNAFQAPSAHKATDESQMVEALGVPVRLVPGSSMNIKITSRDDLRLAEQILKALPKPKLGNLGNPMAGDDLWR